MKDQKVGRPAIGITKKISLTLSDEVWKEIEERCKLGKFSRSEVIREIIDDNLGCQN
jgi:metal-responsive CopG/Arc/MetJ family transcriptional regulator